ncbi:MAG: ISLre2 family transposase [Lachnospiraceae bacterium]
MVNSIRYFEEKCINRFEKLEDDFMKDPAKLAEYVYGITDELHRLGLEMIKESLETMDMMLQKSPVRLKHWVVESHSKKQLTTSLGDVVFSKTLFTNKGTGKSEYLLDRILGIAPNERLTEDAEARLLEEAVQTSYRRGGEEVSLTTEVSKQTVKNKIHSLEFPQNEEEPECKKVVEYLYIDADEDHISLQFREKKGDLKENENHQKNNCLLVKLVYIYEGIENASPKSKRHCLVNPYYFCGVNNGEGNIRFWDEIYEYLNSHYELDKVKKIYVNSDGGSWIKSGMNRIAGITHVLDEFHLEKYLTKLTSHMKDSKEDAADELRAAIRSKTKADFTELVEKLEGYLTGETGMERMEYAKDYILSNWSAAKIRLKHKEGVKGSSTEGHVSHVLSSRMSSRPMGWSVEGATKMAQLRAYYLNGGDMLELVRYQEKKLPQAVGAEYDVLSSTQIKASEKSRHGELGKYTESISHSLSLQNKKIVYFNAHIWGL